jgi:hypothetical protein
MNQLKISAIAIAFSLAFSGAAAAETVTKAQYKSAAESIAGIYKAEKATCDSFSSNAKDICIAEAKGKRSIAKADLEFSYKPSAANSYGVRVAKADAIYSVASERCDDKAGNEKDVCVKEAKAVHTHESSSAKADMKSSNANTVANQKTVSANAKAVDKIVSAQEDATVASRKADYAVAKEKCDAFAGAAKDNCHNQAKSRFGM